MRLYRVRAGRPGDPEDADVLSEMFETKEEAERFYSDVQDDRDGILATLPFPSVSVTLEENHEGVWVRLGRRLVRVQ